tara:strand:+ start:217 stop:390 length:174 start_codon:yes stop_codon:yes gene_type:complete
MYIIDFLLGIHIVIEPNNNILNPKKYTMYSIKLSEKTRQLNDANIKADIIEKVIFLK